MTGRGYLFSLEPEEVREVLAARGHAEVEAVLDGLHGGARWAELDRAWPAIHRSLAATAPLARAVLGGVPLASTPWLLVRLVPAEELGGLVRALDALGWQAFRARFEETAGPEPEGESEEEDALYAWNWFRGLRTFYRAAAEGGRAVVFAGELRRRAWRSRAVA